jgi:hypothetical protein
MQFNLLLDVGKQEGTRARVTAIRIRLISLSTWAVVSVLPQLYFGLLMNIYDQNGNVHFVILPILIILYWVITIASNQNTPLEMAFVAPVNYMKLSIRINWYYSGSM